MRSIRTLILAGVFALPAAPTLAQMYPGQDVTVNPYAIGTVPPRYGMAPIHLHMPVHRRVVHHHAAVAAATPPATGTAPAAQTADTSRPAPAAPPADNSQPSPMIGTMADSTNSQPAPAKPAKKPAPAKTAAASPPPASGDIGPTGMDDAIPFSLDGVHAAAPTKPAPPKHAATPAPTKTASTTPPPVQTAPQPAASQPGMTKRGEILFTKNASDPAPAQFDGLKLLAGDLSEALKNGSSRIQLEAYGGNHGDKGSDARRLSLKRALSIRQVLIDNGVPANVIDVRAMGGADDSGPADRVDVYVRAS
jgi:outer membrane protein OmpA-like peptidoglycan-associated protein